MSFIVPLFALFFAPFVIYTIPFETVDFATRDKLWWIKVMRNGIGLILKNVILAKYKMRLQAQYVG